MEACAEKDIHNQATRRRHLTYCFYPKHHGAGTKSDARWSPDLSRPQEFAVFDMADASQLEDEEGNLYGLHILHSEGRARILPLGERNEMIARFWVEDNPENPWHGHPLWPIQARDSLNRKQQARRPPKIVFDRMVLAGLVSENNALRLRAGRHLGNLFEEI